MDKDKDKKPFPLTCLFCDACGIKPFHELCPHRGQFLCVQCLKEPLPPGSGTMTHHE